MCHIRSRHTTSFLFKGQQELPFASTLVSCFHLPNVFSRNLFTSFATYAFRAQCLEESILLGRFQNIGPVSYAKKDTSPINRMEQWSNLFREFNNFFSYFVFPIYERCFFLLIWDLFKQCSCDSERIEAAIELLESYIRKNSDYILRGGFQSSSWEQLNPPKITDYGKPDMNLITSKLIRTKFNSTLQDILARQDSIIYSKTIPDFNASYFGFKAGEEAHRNLINLYIRTTLDTVSGFSPL